ncbi:MAG: reverse transcriptase family protein [Armatimonadetes bacterium]|nr:reverse transcriptase family protein [Armatimonadota bacterium]
MSNAAIHVGQEAVAVFDMQDFFPSILSVRVLTLFRDAAFYRRLADILTRLTTADGRLQQVLPTSPAIANLLAVPLDNELSSLCSFHGLNYSRYVDDITISGDMTAMSGIDVIVRSAVENNGFAYSESKYRFMTADSPQKVTGILVNSCLQVAPEYESAIIESIDEFGRHSEVLPVDVMAMDYQRILGRVDFCRQVAPPTGRTRTYHLHSGGLAGRGYIVCSICPTGKCQPNKCTKTQFPFTHHYTSSIVVTSILETATHCF